MHGHTAAKSCIELEVACMVFAAEARIGRLLKGDCCLDFKTETSGRTAEREKPKKECEVWPIQ